MAENGEKRITLKVSTKDITEIKSLASPPEAVVKVLSAILFLRGNLDHETDWTYAKKFLGNPSSLTELRNFDLSKCSKEMASKAKETIKDLADKKVRKVSLATVGLYMWTKEVIEYVESN